MDVRLQTVEDSARALKLAPMLDRILSEGTEAFTPHDEFDGTAKAFVERHFGTPETLLVTAHEQDRDGMPIGVCVTGPFEDPMFGERHPLVLVLYVEPNYRHRGLARALIEDVERQLRERGCGALAARAGHNDDALISMGERWGFTRRWELMLRD